MVIEGFEHRTGIHCGSVAMADLLRWAGVELSEPMVFGLGAGLGFYYLKDSGLSPGGLSPSRQIAGRSMRLEEQVARRLGLQLELHRPDGAAAAWEGVRQALEAGRPVMVQCDLARLPYWDTETPFAGHRIVVAGWEPETDEVLVADTHFEGLQTIARDTLQTARASQDSPAFEAPWTWWELEPGEPRRLEEAIPEAIEHNRDLMEEAPVAPGGRGGLEGLEAFGRELPEWQKLEDAAWSYRFAFQVIEKRGTGGANFRNVYRDFLHEASEYVPRLAREQLALSMTRTADAWSTLATYLEAMATFVESEGEAIDEDPSHHVESMAEAVYQFESTFWDRV